MMIVVNFTLVFLFTAMLWIFMYIYRLRILIVLSQLLFFSWTSYFGRVVFYLTQNDIVIIIEIMFYVQSKSEELDQILTFLSIF